MAQTHTNIRAWLVFGTVLAGAVAFSLARTAGKSADFQDCDFGAYYHGAAAVARGATPYFVDARGPLGTFVYSPAFAFALVPLASLEYLWAARLWTVINWGLATGCVALALRLTGTNRTTVAATLLVAVPIAGYVWANVRVGQVGTLVAALCLAWAACRRFGWQFLGGLCLAAAVAVKIAPALLVPYLVIRRDGRGLAGVIVGGVALVLLPAPWVGFDGTVRLHRAWAAHCRLTQVGEQTIRVENQSLLGELARLPWVSEAGYCVDAANFAALESYYPLVALVLAAAVYGWVVCDLRRGGVPREELHLAVLLVAMTLLHPRGWACNFVALALPCALLARSVEHRATSWRPAVVALALVAVACAAPKAAPAPGFSPARWLLQGKDFWAAVAVAVCCCRATTSAGRTVVVEPMRRAA